MDETIVEIEELKCTHCLKTIPEENKFCEHCGYPQNGTVSEKSKFHSERILSNSKSKEAPRLIRKARNTLFFISGIAFLVGIYYHFAQDDTATFISSTILAGAYLILAFWSQKKPLVSLVLALLLFLTNIVINGIIDTSTIYSGILFKGIIIFFLAKGINSALHLRNAK